MAVIVRTRSIDRPSSNARAQKTRDALKDAFARLIQKTRYEELQIAQIIALARTSRSTFYAHYAGMDALLVDSIAGPFALLADTLCPGFVESRLVALLEHFWENRALARGILVGPARRKTTDVLIRLVEDRLKSAGLHRRGTMILPVRLLAIQLAEILLAPITSWLLGESRCTPNALAAGLRRVCLAAIGSMTV